MIDDDHTKRPTTQEALSEATKYFIKYYKNTSIESFFDCFNIEIHGLFVYFEDKSLVGFFADIFSHSVHCLIILLIVVFLIANLSQLLCRIVKRALVIRCFMVVNFWKT